MAEQAASEHLPVTVVSLPKQSHLYVLQSCVDGAFAEADSFFVPVIVNGLTRGLDIASVHKELVAKAEQVPTRSRPGYNNGPGGQGGLVLNFPIPEARSTLDKDFVVRPYAPAE